MYIFWRYISSLDRALHWPSSRWVRFSTTQCVCNWGSSSRDVLWQKVATTRLPVLTFSVRPFCVCLACARVSTYCKVCATAFSCASRTRSSCATSARILTDFGALKVRSTPALRVRSSPPSAIWNLPCGSLPSSNAWKSSSRTSPLSPRASAPRPCH